MSWDTPFTLSGEDRAFIESTAGQAALALDRARIFESERATAETLQRSVLPASLPRVDGVQLAARYLPGSQGVAVGGDWFDALELHDGRLGLSSATRRHGGVQAAASMGQLRNALRAFSVERLKPSSALARLDRLGDETREAALQLSSTPSSILETVFRFSSAGHPPPVVAYPDGRVELLEDGRGLPLGTECARSTGRRWPSYRRRRPRPLLGRPDRAARAVHRRRARTARGGYPRSVEGARAPSRAHPRSSRRRCAAHRRHRAPRSPLTCRTATARAAAPDHDRRAVRRSGRPSRVDRWVAVRSFRVRKPGPGRVGGLGERGRARREHGRRHRCSSRCQDSTIRVTVEDNGRWVPPTDRPGRGFGLQLMRSLTSSVEVVPGSDDRGTR